MAEALVVVQQAVSGNAVHALITGAKGIGKTSLALALDRIASGDPDYLRLVEIEDSRVWQPMLVVTVVGQPWWTPADMSTAVAREVERTFGFAGGPKPTDVEIDLKIARFKLGSVAPSVSDDPATSLAEYLTDTWANVRGSVAGIMIMVDEAERIATVSGMGGFLKALTELLARSRLDSVCLVLVGTNDVPEAIGKDHGGAPRIFRSIDMPRLDAMDVRELFDKTLLGTGIDITQPAVRQTAEESGGLPFLVQSIGYEAFRLLRPIDRRIDLRMIRESARRL